MYNDNCKPEGCAVPAAVESMKNIVVGIRDHAVKAREMAFVIHKKLFGTIPIDVNDDKEVGCAFDALIDICRIEKETLEVLYAVIERIGE